MGEPQSAMWSLTGTILCPCATGVITSVDGIKTDSYRVKDGMLEHVSSFNGRPLSAAEYKALSHKLPLVTPGSYKIDLPTEH